MGAQNRFGFTLDVPRELEDAEFAHTLRLVVARSGDGTYPGDTGPSHRYIDVHSTWDTGTETWVRQDVPISADDLRTLRMIGRLSIMAMEPGAEGEKLSEAMKLIAAATWGDEIADEIIAVATDDGNDYSGLVAMARIAAFRATLGGVTP